MGENLGWTCGTLTMDMSVVHHARVLRRGSFPRQQSPRKDCFLFTLVLGSGPKSRLEWDSGGVLWLRFILFVLWSTTFISFYGRVAPVRWNKEDRANSANLFWPYFHPLFLIVPSEPKRCDSWFRFSLFLLFRTFEFPSFLPRHRLVICLPCRSWSLWRPQTRPWERRYPPWRREPSFTPPPWSATSLSAASVVVAPVLRPLPLSPARFRLRPPPPRQPLPPRLPSEGIRLWPRHPRPRPLAALYLPHIPPSRRPLCTLCFMTSVATPPAPRLEHRVLGASHRLPRIPWLKSWSIQSWVPATSLLPLLGSFCPCSPSPAPPEGPRSQMDLSLRCPSWRTPPGTSAFRSSSRSTSGSYKSTRWTPPAPEQQISNGHGG